MVAESTGHLAMGDFGAEAVLAEGNRRPPTLSA